jgi:hypothetical protein
MPHRRLTALMGALLLLAACTDEGPDDDAGSPTRSSPVSSSSASPSAPTSGSASASPPPSVPTDEQPPDASFPADTADDGGPEQPGAAGDPAGTTRVSGLRLGAHDGYSRLVVDLDGSGVPEWTVGYSEASGPGGGPVDITGDAFLRVRLRTQAEPGGQSTSQVMGSPGPIVEAVTTGSFEGYEEVLIGIDGGEQPFRAFPLTDPGRLVIDVRPGR